MTKHGTVIPCFVDFFLVQLPGRELTLLQGQAAVRAAGAGRVKADHTRLVGAEHALTGGANRNRGSGDGVADRRRIAVARPYKRVAALGAGGKNLVKQAGLSRSSRARSRTTQSCQRSWEAIVRVGGRIRHSGGVDRTDRANRGSFVCCHTRPK